MKRSVRQDVWDAIDGRCEVVTERRGIHQRYYSRCLECGLDSGPWLLRFEAAISSLLHLNAHHPKERP